MNSLWKCVVTFIIATLLASGVWFYVMYLRTEKITQGFESEIAQLSATLDALGPSVECYTVSEEYSQFHNNNTAGQVLADASIIPITVPSSLVGEAYVTDKSLIVGRYCKVNIMPGTPITADLLMSEKYDDTLRDVDISVNSRVVGMRVGDYVDLRITLPFGEDYVVLPHKRVQGISDRTVKFYMTETEWHTWQAATVDYYIHSSAGCRIYLTKYIEPGVQESAVAYYAPSRRVYEVMLKDPNVLSEARRLLDASQSNRPAIEGLMGEVLPENSTVMVQSGLIAGGRATWSGDVMADYNTEYKQYQSNVSVDEEGNPLYVEEDVVVNFEGTPTESETVSETEAVTTTTTLPADTETTQSAFTEETPTSAPQTETETFAPEETYPVETESQEPIMEPEIEDPDTVG